MIVSEPVGAVEEKDRSRFAYVWLQAGGWLLELEVKTLHIAVMTVFAAPSISRAVLLVGVLS